MKFVILFLAACGTLNEQTEQQAQKDVSATSSAAVSGNTSVANNAIVSSSRSRGLWVYNSGTWIGDTTQVNQLISLMLEQGMNEVYLSTNLALLENGALPAFIQRMSNNGFAVEALMGETSWSEESGVADMVSNFAKLLAYNAAQSYAQRFKSVHLDVEPWVGTGTDASWLTPLLGCYSAAKSALGASGIHLSVDLAGSKAMNLSLAERQALVDAADKVVLMQYEVAAADVLSHSQRFLSGLSAIAGQTTVVAVRAEDFTQPYGEVSAIESNLTSSAGYHGWALFDYSELL